MALVDDVAVFRNVFFSEVIRAKQVNKLRLGFSRPVRGNSKIKSTSSGNFVVENVNTIPVFFRVNNALVLANLVYSSKDSFTVCSLESMSTDNNHSSLGVSDLLSVRVRAVGNLLESIRSVS